MKGKFITIEGTDGVGKTTQINLLVEKLMQWGVPLLLVREPGGTVIGEKIRDMILDIANVEMTSMTEAMLYAAARTQLVDEKIVPALEEGYTVVCDRFVDSSIAYQGYARGLGQERVMAINRYALERVTPDLTLYLDLPPEIGIARKKNVQALDRMEQEQMDFHNRVYAGYQALVKQYPQRIKAIDASLCVPQVHEKIMEAVALLYPSH